MIFPSWLMPEDMGPTPVLLMFGASIVLAWFLLPRRR